MRVFSEPSLRDFTSFPRWALPEKPAKDSFPIQIHFPVWNEPEDTGNEELRLEKLPVFELISPSELPLIIPDGNMDGLKTALRRQIVRCQKQNPDIKWKFGQRLVSRKEWCIETNRAMLELAKDADSFEKLWGRAKEHFHWYRSTGSDGNGQIFFTGYYLPILYGKRTPSGVFNYPLYKRPSDLVRVLINDNYRWQRLLSDGSFTDYFSRYAIDWEGALDGRGLEIAFVSNPVDAFFLHIQGSGAVILEDEEGKQKKIMVNYAAQNGHSYVTIGRILKNEGVDPSYLTLQGLKRYFRERPDEIDRILPMNPSYIFFSESNTGPYGSGATILVDGHSIATDDRVYPPGALALISTEKPLIENEEIVDWTPFTRLMLNQDTGGAINGPGRVDIYWGEGLHAELTAGHQSHTGEIYLAVIPEN